MGDVGSNIKLKRVYDPSVDSDGYRVLATRFWPRGVPRSQVDEYISKLAPSKQLLKEYKDVPLSWADFTDRYRQELSLEEQQSELKRLAGVARTKTITLLCFCAEERGCHRTLLREAIVEVDEAR
jgi:uncharacterized protein YeaO (DUF488 family)